jgi:hypothetical protein
VYSLPSSYFLALCCCQANSSKGKLEAAELAVTEADEALTRLEEKKRARRGAAKIQHDAAVEKAQEAVKAAREKVVEARTHHAKVCEARKVRVRAV